MQKIVRTNVFKKPQNLKEHPGNNTSELKIKSHQEQQDSQVCNTTPVPSTIEIEEENSFLQFWLSHLLWMVKILSQKSGFSLSLYL